MMRVYDLLKARVMSGEFAPGSRLDPMRLRRELGSSATPVRDALHRLTGERLIESWRNEGFRIPHISEPAIRDLYEWTHELSHVVLRAASRHPAGLAWHREILDYPGHHRLLLGYAAARSRSLEHGWAVSNLCDRSELLWRAEAMVVNGAHDDVERLEQALDRDSWLDAVKAIDHLHRKRAKKVADVAEWLRNSRADYAENVF
jgi:DNA-binding transcriptional regulator YhcF (GntR family)